MYEYLTLGISCAAICITLYLAFHKENTMRHDKENAEKESLSVAFAKMDTKQNTILNAINDIRIDQKAQSNKINELDKKIILIDQSAHSAHHRIDDLISSLNVSVDRNKEE